MRSKLVTISLALAIINACSASPARESPEARATPPAAATADADAWPSFAPGPALTSLPDGVYVHTAVRAALVAAGATGVDVENAGRWTLTVNGTDGTLVLRHDDAHADETWTAHFTVMGDRVRFQLPDEFFDVRWRDAGTSLDLAIVAADTQFGSHSNDAVAYRILSAILGGEWTKQA